MNLIYVLKRNIYALATAVSTSVIFGLQVRLDPNNYHDGFVFAGALAASKGMVSNRDFFNHYGPITPEIQGLWLRLTGRTLLDLRIFNAILLICISCILFSILCKTFQKRLSYIIVILWALSSPRVLPANLPWSSVITTLFILIAIKLIPLAFSLRKFYSKFAMFSLGAILLLFGFARIHVWVILVLVFLSLFYKRKSLNNHLFKYYLLGIILSAFLALLILMQFGMFGGWVNDCIFYSFHAYAGSKPDIKAEIVNLLTPIFFVYFSGLFFLYLKYSSKVKNIFLKLGPVVAILLVSFYFQNLNIPINRMTFRNPLFMLKYQSENLHYLIIDLALFLIVDLSYKYLRFGNGSLDPQNLTLLAFGIGSVAQLYPSPDNFHAWWISPICLAAIASHSSTKEWMTNRSTTLREVERIFSVFAYALLILLAFNLSAPRTRVDSHELQGMLGSKIGATSRTINLLTEYGEAHQVNFDCGDGIYAVVGDKYLPYNRRYVNWAPESKTTSTFEEYFKCDKSNLSQNSLPPGKWKLIFEVASQDGNTSNVLYKRTN